MRKILSRLHAWAKGNLWNGALALACVWFTWTSPTFGAALPFICLGGSVLLLAVALTLTAGWDRKRAAALRDLQEAARLKQQAEQAWERALRSGASWASPAQLEQLVRLGAPAYFAVEFVHERSADLPFGSVRVRLEEGAGT